MTWAKVASLRLWSIEPEFRQADKNFVTGIATDPVNCISRAIQHTRTTAARWYRRGLENAQDSASRRISASPAPGFFIGRPAENPILAHRRGGDRVADFRRAVIPAARLRRPARNRRARFRALGGFGGAPTPISLQLARFAQAALLHRPSGDRTAVLGRLSLTQIELVAASPVGDRLLSAARSSWPTRRRSARGGSRPVSAHGVAGESDSSHRRRRLVIMSRVQLPRHGRQRPSGSALQNSRCCGALPIRHSPPRQVPSPNTSSACFRAGAVRRVFV